jgi:hypothetical protein
MQRLSLSALLLPGTQPPGPLLRIITVSHYVCLQIASVSNSPLISQAVASPVVARSLLKDPAERDRLLQLGKHRPMAGVRGAAGGGGGSGGRGSAARRTREAFATVAAAQGVHLNKVTVKAVKQMVPTDGTLNTAGEGWGFRW